MILDEVISNLKLYGVSYSGFTIQVYIVRNTMVVGMSDGEKLEMKAQQGKKMKKGKRRKLQPYALKSHLLFVL